jgi:hypothetical protein
MVHAANEIPGWMMRLTISDLVGAVAYTQAFALIESVLVTTLLVVAALALPRGWLAERFVSHGSLIVVAGAVWMVALQFFYEYVRQWGAVHFLLWAVPGLLSLAIPYYLIRRHARLDGWVRNAIQRVAVLSFVYATLGLVSLLIVIARNIW